MGNNFTKRLSDEPFHCKFVKNTRISFWFKTPIHTCTSVFILSFWKLDIIFSHSSAWSYTLTHFADQAFDRPMALLSNFIFYLSYGMFLLSIFDGCVMLTGEGLPSGRLFSPIFGMQEGQQHWIENIPTDGQLKYHTSLTRQVVCIKSSFKQISLHFLRKEIGRNVWHYLIPFPMKVIPAYSTTNISISFQSVLWWVCDFKKIKLTNLTWNLIWSRGLTDVAHGPVIVPCRDILSEPVVLTEAAFGNYHSLSVKQYLPF